MTAVHPITIATDATPAERFYDQMELDEKTTAMRANALLLAIQLGLGLWEGVALGTNRAPQAGGAAAGCMIAMVCRIVVFHSGRGQEEYGQIILKVATAGALVGTAIAGSVPLMGVATAVAGLIALKDIRTVYQRWKLNE
jgi:hypothetical protein